MKQLGLWMYALSLPLAGCVFNEVDVSEKGCPCDVGFVCDVLNDLCVADTRVRGRVVVSGLEPVWTTPDSVFWTWDVSGEPSDLAGYELWMSESERDVLAGEPRMLWTAAQYPELGPNPSGQTRFAVTRVLIRGVRAATPYFARLVAIDRDGHEMWDDASATTPEVATDAIEVVAETDPVLPGGRAPACFRFIEDFIDSYAATRHHYVYTTICDGDNAVCLPFDGDRAPDCRASLEWSGMDVDLGELPAARFGSAYLELALSAAGSSRLEDVEVYVGFGEGTEAFGVRGLTLENDGEYRRFQLKLDALRRDLVGAPLTFDDLHGRLTRLAIGARVADGTIVRVDEVFVRF